jgi:uncharacterized protein (TIGR02145 family)
MKKQFFFISFFIGLSLIMGLSSCEDKDENNLYNGHEYVDLGLSVKWATCNVGATKPEALGDYFAWGETSPKNSYTESNYTYSNNPSTLPLNKDAASVNMGGKWRMPTKEEWQELIEKCSLERITQNGVNGYKVIGPNGNFIFLPANGLYNSFTGRREDEDMCYYWSSSLHETVPSAAYMMTMFRTDDYDESVAGGAWDNAIARRCGLPIRGVCE